MVPLKEPLSISSDVSWIKLPNSAGNVPPRFAFESKSKETRLGRAESSLGRVPTKLFSSVRN